MKKTIQYLFLLLFVVAISGCSPFGDSGMIMDYANISFKIDLTDSRGHSLILPTTKEGEAYLSEVYIEWGDKKFYCEGEPARSKMRANIEGYHALTVSQEGEAYYTLEFGEFQPYYFEPELLILHLPGGVVRKIEMQHYTSDEFNFITKLRVDGKEVVLQKNHLFRIELSDEEITQSGYDLEDMTPAPQTLYFRFASKFPQEPWRKGLKDMDKEAPPLPDSIVKAFSALWRGVALPLEHRTNGTPIDRTLTEPQFYYGASRFLSIYTLVEPSYFLAFGPLPEETLKGEPLTIQYTEEQSYTFLIDYERDSSGKAHLSAKRAGEEGQDDRNINYFRNGIVVTIPIEW